MPEGQLCFCNFSFLAESDPYISAGFKKQSVFRALAVSANYILTFSQKRKNDSVLFFLKHGGWDTSLDSKSENKYRSDLYFGDSRVCLFFVCNHTSASDNFICLSSHSKILAESFQFDWIENIFYKLEKYIQPDCMTTNQNTTHRIMEKITFSIFQNENLN